MLSSKLPNNYYIKILGTHVHVLRLEYFIPDSCNQLTCYETPRAYKF